MSRLFFLGIVAVAVGFGHQHDNPVNKGIGNPVIPAGKNELLAYLANLSKNDRDLERVEELARQLASESFARRQDATEKLVALGPVAVSALQPLLRDKDLEVVRRSQVCIRRIDKNYSSIKEEAAVRALLESGDSETVAALVRFLPYAVDDELQDEIWFGLYGLAKKNPKLLQVFVEQMQSPLPARRAIAGFHLARLGNAAQRHAARRLIDDPAASVRLRTAQAFLASQDPAGIPTLIKLLEGTLVPIAWQAEELLTWTAGDSAPAPTVGNGNAQARRTCRDAWENWWKQQKPEFAFNTPEQIYRRPGLAFLHESLGAGNAKYDYYLWLCGCNGKLRFDIGVRYAAGNVYLHSDGRLLVAGAPDKGEPELTERAVEGNAFWQADGLRPVFAARPLASGTILALHRGFGEAVTEVGPGGKVVNVQKSLEINRVRFKPFQVSRHGVVLASIERQGAIEVAEFDARSGRALKHHPLELGAAKDTPRIHYWVEPLPGGGYVVAETFPFSKDPGEPGGVIKTNSEGKASWGKKLAGARFATALPNGNLLVTTGSRLGAKVMELGPKGNVHCELLLANNIPQVRPCLSLVRLGFDRAHDDDFDLATAVPYRLRDLASKDARVRLRAVIEMETLGANAPGAFSALMELLKDPDRDVRNQANEVMAALSGHLTQEFLNGLKQPDTNMRVQIISVLNTAQQRFLLYGHPKIDTDSFMSPLLEAIEDRNALVRRRAAAGLGYFEQHAKKVVPPLVKALRDTEDTNDPFGATVAQAAAGSLARIGAPADAAIPALLEQLKDANLALQRDLLSALGLIRTRPDTVIPVLKQLVEDKARDPMIRVIAIYTLQRYSKERPNEVRSVLSSFIEDGNERIRTEAANALKQLER